MLVCLLPPFEYQQLEPWLQKQKANQGKKGFLSKSWQITSSGMFAGSCIGVICLVLCLEFLRRIAREYDAFIIRRARLRAQYLSPSSSSPSSSLLAPERDDNAGGDCCQPQGQQIQIQGQTQAKSDPLPTVSGPVSTSAAAAGGGDRLDSVRPTIVEHTIRSLLHMLQFAVAYFVMLLAMYFNGYFIICIFIGAFLGAFLFSWEPLVVRREYACSPSSLSPEYANNLSRNDPMAVTKCCG